MASQEQGPGRRPAEGRSHPEIRTGRARQGRNQLPQFSSTAFPWEMPANSDFQQAIQAAQRSQIVGPNVLRKALPVLGGGMV